MRNVEDTNVVEIYQVSKSFNNHKVVNNISFNVMQGEILGLIGPNGAGKTTTIRMIMDIIKPDSGRIIILGQRLSENTKDKMDKVGYLPEERGLYRKLTVQDTLTYLASLKGVSAQVVNSRAEELLRRVGMLAHREKKAEELSRGMGQLIQFIVTIIHNPHLIILDEPFAGLDPVNTELLKEMILELRNQGKAIMLSTHRMNEVEELCDRIFMMNRGNRVLYGELAEIKDRYRNNSILLEFEGELGEIEGVTRRQDSHEYVELFLDGETPPQKVLEQLVGKGVRVTRFEVSTPSLNDIFLQIVDKGQ